MKTDRIDRICFTCKKHFKARKDEVKRGYGRFCNHKCYFLWRKTLIGSKNPCWKVGKLKRKCLKCGKVFYVYPSNINNRKCCSLKCANINKITKKKTKCFICGKEIEVHLSDIKRIKTPKCCSPKCRAIKISRIYIKEKSVNWLGGKTLEKYGSGFTDRIRNQVRKRDGHKCQLCGKNLRYVKILWDTHHIDYNKKNHNLMNLILLCRRCHCKTNFNREIWRMCLERLMRERFK